MRGINVKKLTVFLLIIMLLIPKCVFADTIKGKGVSFMENQCGWHGVAPNDEQYVQAIKELDEQLAAL